MAPMAYHMRHKKHKTLCRILDVIDNHVESAYHFTQI